MVRNVYALPVAPFMSSYYYTRFPFGAHEVGVVSMGWALYAGDPAPQRDGDDCVSELSSGPYACSDHPARVRYEIDAAINTDVWRGWSVRPKPMRFDSAEIVDLHLCVAEMPHDL